MPIGDPGDGFFYPTLTLMIDSYIHFDYKPLSHVSSILPSIPRRPREVQIAEVRAVRSQSSPNKALVTPSRVSTALTQGV